MPLDSVECGYADENCTLVTEIIVCASIAATLFFLLLISCIRKQWLNHQLASAVWRLDSDKLMISSCNASKASPIGSSTSNYTMDETIIGVNTAVQMPIGYVVNVLNEDPLQKSAMFEGVNVVIAMINQRSKIGINDFDRHSLHLLYKLKNLNVDRLNAFIGLAFNHGNHMWVVWKFEARCTLHDVLFHEEFDLNEQFQASFLNDSVKVRGICVGYK